MTTTTLIGSVYSASFGGNSYMSMGGGGWLQVGNTGINLDGLSLGEQLEVGLALSMAQMKAQMKQQRAITRALVGYGGAQSRSECMGLCHGIPGRGDVPQLSDKRSRALANSILSAIGSGLAGVGCSSGLTCATAGLLAVDSARQLDFALRGVDPVERIVLSLGGTNEQARASASGLNYITAAVSISAAYKMTLMSVVSQSKSTHRFYSAVTFDAYSSAVTVDNLGN